MPLTGDSVLWKTQSVRFKTANKACQLHIPQMGYAFVILDQFVHCFPRRL
jgi:hypothetical protein